MRDNLSELEIKQMDTISDLQDKINLFEFDVSENRKQINLLKKRLIAKRKLIKGVIKELEDIRKEENYNKITNVLVILNSSLKTK